VKVGVVLDMGVAWRAGWLGLNCDVRSWQLHRDPIADPAADIASPFAITDHHVHGENVLSRAKGPDVQIVYRVDALDARGVPPGELIHFCHATAAAFEARGD
jgi:hypothetical protein